MQSAVDAKKALTLATPAPRLIPDEQRLMHTMLTNYDPAARPVYNASQNVTVAFIFTLTQIVDVDEVNQVLTTNVWLEQEWMDERLLWDPADYNGLNRLRLPCEKIWLPDIVLYNNADDYASGYMQSKAMVDYYGRVFWPPPAKFRSSCKIDITFFPFDDQICEMKFGSWTYDGYQVDLITRSDHVEMHHFVESGEWHLIGVYVRRNVVIYECCSEPYPDVTFTIIIRRRILYYLFNIVLPCVWLTILCLLGFWLPPECGEKVSLGITVLLAFSVFMLLVAESMPQTSEFVPLIGIFLTITMAMTSMSIVSTVLILNIHHVTMFRKPVPKWARLVFFHIIGPAICLSSEIRRAQRHHSTRLSQALQKITYSRGNVLRANGQKQAGGRPERRWGGRQGASAWRPTVMVNEVNETSPLFGHGADQPKRRAAPAALADAGLHGAAHHRNRLMNVLAQQELDDERRTMTVTEWRLLAFIIDRLLFYVFLLIAFISSIVTLLVLPLLKPDPKTLIPMPTKSA